MSKITLSFKKFGGFMKRNAFYFLIVLCIASVATVIGLAVTNNLGGGDTNLSAGDDDINTNKPEDPVVPDPVVKQTFIAPCNGTISQGYIDDSAVWNSTLEQFSAHSGLDFVSDDLNVFASSEGTVKEIGYNDLDGNYIILTHDNGYETYYYSLQDASTLKVGAKVEQGQNIGKISDTQGIESLDGNHLHFEMTKDGEVINPLDVLILEEK